MSYGRPHHRGNGAGLRRENLIWETERGRESRSPFTASDNEHPHDVGVQKRKSRRQDRRRNAEKSARIEDNKPSLDERDWACLSNKPQREKFVNISVIGLEIGFDTFSHRISYDHAVIIANLIQ